MADQAQQEQQQQEQSVQQQQPATVVQHDAEMQDAAPDLPRPQKNVTAAQLQALLDGGVAAFEADGPTDFVVDQGHRVTLANAVADLMESTGVIKAQNDKLEAFEQLVKQKDAKASATELELLSAKGAQAARAEKAEAAAAELGRHKVNLNVALDHIVTMETALRVITAIGALEPEDLSATGKRDLAAAVGGHKGGGNGGGGNKRHRTDPGASGPADAARPAGNAVRTAGNGGGGHKEYPAYCIPKACRLRRKAANQCIKCGVADHFIADCPATEFKDDEGKIYHPKA